MPTGGGVKAPELHEDSPETYYVHTPGVKVAIPSTPADAKGLLAAAIRSPDPVVVLEPKVLYRSPREEVPDGEYVVPLGKARIAREGSEVTLIAYGGMVQVALDAAEELDARAEVEVDAVAGADHLDRAAAALAAPDPLGHVDGLAERMRVPGGAGARREVHAERLHAGRG